MSFLKTVFHHNVNDLAKLICLASPMRSYTIFSHYYCHNDRVNSCQQSILSIKEQPNLQVSKRFKKKQSKVEKILDEIKEMQEEESDSDEDDDDHHHGMKQLTNRISALRLDIIAKLGSGLSRNKVEKLFYEGKVYLNGAKATKKGIDIKLNDVVEIVKEEGPDTSLISKITLIAWKLENMGYKITYTRENFESSKYKS